MRVVAQTDTGGSPKIARGVEVGGEGGGNECECTITGDEIYAKLDEAGYINEIKFVDPEAIPECLEKYSKQNKTIQMFMAYNDELENTSRRYLLTVEDFKRIIEGATMTVKGCIDISEEASRDIGEPPEI